MSVNDLDDGIVNKSDSSDTEPVSKNKNCETVKYVIIHRMFFK